MLPIEKVKSEEIPPHFPCCVCKQPLQERFAKVKAEGLLYLISAGRPSPTLTTLGRQARQSLPFLASGWFGCLSLSLDNVDTRSGLDSLRLPAILERLAFKAFPAGQSTTIPDFIRETASLILATTLLTICVLKNISPTHLYSDA